MRLLMRLATVIFSLALLPPPAWAGVLIISDQHSMVDPADKESSTVYIERDRMRVETKGPEGEFILIYREDKDAFWTIEPAKGTYFEMTKESMQNMKERMEEQMKGVREMMAEQMKNMSPEQRKMMEQMGGGPMIMGPPPSPVYKKVASGVKAGRWSCDKYVGYQRGEKVEEVCAVDFGQLGLNPDDFEVMEGMQKFTDNLSGGGESGGLKGWQEDQGYPGLPIGEVSFSNGRMTERTEVREIRKENFPASLFELPKGLKKMEEPFSQEMPQRRQR